MIKDESIKKIVIQKQKSLKEVNECLGVWWMVPMGKMVKKCYQGTNDMERDY